MHEHPYRVEEVIEASGKVRTVCIRDLADEGQRPSYLLELFLFDPDTDMAIVRAAALRAIAYLERER